MIKHPKFNYPADFLRWEKASIKRMRLRRLPKEPESMQGEHVGNEISIEDKAKTYINPNFKRTRKERKHIKMLNRLVWLNLNVGEKARRNNEILKSIIEKAR